MRMTRVDPAKDPIADSSPWDAVVLPAERASVLTMVNPRWTVVVPGPDVVKVPVAFVLGGHDPAWAGFVNAWIEMKKRDGTLDTLYEYWILGKNAVRAEPRWSAIRNVLHWVE